MVAAPPPETPDIHQPRDHQLKHLAAIINSSDDAIVSKNTDGIIQSWNPAAERMFGYSAAEAIGQSIRIIIPADRQYEEDEVLARIRRGESIEHFETVRQRKDGSLLPISLTVSPIRNDAGVVVGASKIARDLSPLHAHAAQLEELVRQRTAELETANTQLESFAYSVSHDLRAPLRGMQGLAQALLEDCSERLDARGRDYARRIVSEAALLDRLIQDLLAYSRLTRIEVTLDTVPLGEAVDAAVHQLQEEISAAGGRIQVETTLPSVTGNRAVLIQVLTNLLSNAVKFGGRAPVVRVSGGREGAKSWLAVQDSGIGIAPEHHERIFRVFERLHSTEQYPGTGIGLAIVRKGMERLGGRVGLDSTPGQGSRFWIELPAAEAA